MRKIEDMTLDEKIGEILKYQRRFYHMTIARAITGVLLFLILVVFPILGFYYLANYLKEAVSPSLTEASETLQKVKGITDLGEIESLKNLLQ